MYQAPHSMKKLCVVMDDTERNNILWHTHSAPTAGHSGVGATVQKISSRYFINCIKLIQKFYKINIATCYFSH